MEFKSNRLSEHERTLLHILKEHGIQAAFPHTFDLWDSFSKDIRDFFDRLTQEGLNRILDTLSQKGYLIRDNEGWYKLRGESGVTEVAIVGRITAGHLREAISDPIGTVRFSGTLYQPEQLFAFQVDGDSMAGDHIEHGDCVMLRQVEVHNGQIGAVVVDGETTLKRIYKEAYGLRLEPSNPVYTPIFIPSDRMIDCTILGRLEAIISHRSGDVTWFNTRSSTTELTMYLN